MPDTAHAEIGPDLHALAAENARLAERLRLAEASAASQAIRAQAWSWQAGQLSASMAQMRASLFWRLTWPLRLAVVMARGLPANTAEGAAIRHVWRLFSREGAGATARAVRRWLRRGRAGPATVARPALGDTADQESDDQFPVISMVPMVLIVAELSVPQCAKYRVWQKQEHFARLGVACRVINWHDANACFSAAVTASQVILYRVPATTEMLALIAYLHELGLRPYWEVDDLIFDEALYRQNSNLADLEPELRHSVLEGVALYRRALLACGRGIASTEPLAQAMRDAGVAEVSVIENALDEESLSVAAEVVAARTDHEGVLITYGSGTKTHDTDFRQASPALLRLMQARPEVSLRIIGELALPDAFKAVGARIERLPSVPYARYLALLGESDISIAPLEPSVFNDAKSNIKFLEAAILGMPSVCSPRAQFAAVMIDGQTGFMADDEAAWFAALDSLTADAALRARVGQAAHALAVARYAPAAIAHDQVAPLIEAPSTTRPPGTLRVLMANVFYAPRSFGGATIVVEEMARRLHGMAGTEITVVTTLGPDARRQAATRQVQNGITVFALPTAAQDVIAAYDDPDCAREFGHILDAVRPDIVHLHSIQHLGATIAVACRERDIPYVITLHDPWWLCARQFMVTGQGRYCFQKRIDLHVCEACVPGSNHLRERLDLLRCVLDGAAQLLCPSASHRALYLAQGIASERIVVAPNGVRLPGRAPERVLSPRIRFGYVGGNEAVKGYTLLHAAFAALTRTDWELVLVDNTLNLGFASIAAADWKVAGRVRIVPAYTQDTMEAFFEDIDVLLFPSQWKESFGLTVREALVRDVWVIATDGGGPAEAISDGVNGTIIPLDGQYRTLQRAIEDVLDHPVRLADYRNPRAGDVVGYEAQALELRGLLARVVHAAKVGR